MWRDFDLVKLSHFHIASKNNFFEIRIPQGMIVQVLLCFHCFQWLIPKAWQSYASTLKRGEMAVFAGLEF